MRYAGQNYELPVSVAEGRLDSDLLRHVRESFAAEHERMYGYSEPGEPIQGVTFRLEALGVVDRPPLRAQPLQGANASQAVAETRQVYMPEQGGFVATRVYARTRLQPGNELIGPCIVEQMDTTTVLLPGDLARVDAYGNLIITVGG
jgi:N-methylhydantoinase A